VGLTLKFGGGEAEADPFLDQGAQALIVAQLELDRGEIFRADKLAAAFALPGITDLVIGSVLFGRLGLAAAARGAADVVLLREVTWAQRTELGQFGLDLRDPPLDGGGLGFGAHGRQCSGLRWRSRPAACTDIYIMLSVRLPVVFY